MKRVWSDSVNNDNSSSSHGSMQRATLSDLEREEQGMIQHKLQQNSTQTPEFI